MFVHTKMVSRSRNSKKGPIIHKPNRQIMFNHKPHRKLKIEYPSIDVSCVEYPSIDVSYAPT